MLVVPKLLVLVFLQVFENILPWAIRSIIAFVCPFDTYKISLSLAAGSYNSAKMVLWQLASTRRESIMRAIFLGMILIPYISIGFMVTIFEKSSKELSGEPTLSLNTQKYQIFDTYQTLTFHKINSNKLYEESYNIIKHLRMPRTTGGLDCNTIGSGMANSKTLNESNLYDPILKGVTNFREQVRNEIPVGGVTPFFVPINTFMINGIYSGSDIPGISLGGSGDSHRISSYYRSFHSLGSLSDDKFTWYTKIDINSTNKYEGEITDQIFEQEPFSKFRGFQYETNTCELMEGKTTYFLTFKNITSTMSSGSMITIAEVKVWRWLMHNYHKLGTMKQTFRIYADFGVLNSSYFQAERYQQNYTDPDLTGIMKALKRSMVKKDGESYNGYYNEKISKG